MSEDWKQYREEQKERRAERLPERQKQIEDLAAEGYKVDKKTDYQYRINDAFDLYPIHNRWHDLKTGKRGGARNLVDFVRTKLKP